MNTSINGSEDREAQQADAPATPRPVLRSRKVWAGLLALAVTLGLWGLGELDGAAVVEALSWIAGIFMGAVALEDGLRGLLSSRSRAE